MSINDTSKKNVSLIYIDKDFLYNYRTLIIGYHHRMGICKISFFFKPLE